MGCTRRLGDRRPCHLRLLLEVLSHERRWEHALLVVCKLRGIGVLLGIRVGDSLIECTSHCHMVGEIGCETSIKVRRASLQMSCQSSVLKGKVVVFLFVHFFVDDILFGDSQRATCSSFVNLRGSSGRLDTGLKASIASSRSGNVCPGKGQYADLDMTRLTDGHQYRSWFSSWVLSVLIAFAGGMVR